MNIGKYIILFIWILNSIYSFSQESSLGHKNFSFKRSMPEILSKINVGFYVKGNDQKIKALCKQKQAKYFRKSGGWHYLRISPKKLTDFITNSEVKSFHIPFEKGTPLNDTMRVNNRINDIHSGNSPLSNTYSGNGVIIGFIDTGIDYNHDDFKNTDGSTRLLYLWDQTLGVAANTPQPYGYGQQWNANGINSGLTSAHNDIYGHGTLVAGTAAGNGSAVSKHKGIAYEAEIIAVEVDFSANFLTNVQDATEYIYHIADSLGKPCVINASAGTYSGSHDAKDPSAVYIDNLITSSNGHLFVCSAGNSGGNNFHLQHNSLPNDTLFTLFKNNNSLDYSTYGCVPYCYGDNSVHFMGYADVSNFNNVELAVSAYAGNQQSGISNYFNIQDYLAGNYYTDNYGAYVDSIVNSNNERIGMVFMFASLQYGSVYNYEIIISPDSSSNYLWGLHSTGLGKSDIWSDETYYGRSNIIQSSDTEFPFSSTPSNYIDPDSFQNICSSFQCLPSVITVANYVNESGYINSLGNWVNEGGNRGEIASSSSSGPTRNGILKPDIAASGKTTVSSYPSYLLSSKTSAQLGDGGLHYRNGGTSMSSPVVAGIAALYLEKCNQSNYQNFKSDLLSSAYTDSYTGSVPNYSFGYGKVDGFQTLISSGVNDTITQSSCNSFLWDGTLYDSSGFYSYTGLNSKNCDSVLVLNLTIHKDKNSIDSVVSCNSYTWIDGITYTTSNNSATFNTTTINGCDSIIQLNFIIQSEDLDFDTITSCNQYLFQGITLSSSGDYIDTLSNINGCDSIIKLNLTINNGYNDTLFISSCDEFSWENSSYNSSGIYTNNLINSIGCDSMLVLDLTINQSYFDTLITFSCDSFNWNNQSFTSSGFYSDSNLNISGCDSIKHLHLTINNSFIDTIVAAACDTFNWDSIPYTTSGYYTNNYSSVHTCDSTITLELVINENQSSPLTLQLILDDYCLETHWTVKDSHDSIWYDEGPYDCNPNGGGNQANDTVIKDIYVDALDCYTFTLYDDYNDGMSASTWNGTDGSWILNDNNGNILSHGEGNFGSSVEIDFYVTSAIPSNINSTNSKQNIKAYPNPFATSTSIMIKNFNPPFQFKIYDIQGRIIQKEITNSNPFLIYKNTLSKGIYWLEISNYPAINPLKLILY